MAKIVFVHDNGIIDQYTLQEDDLVPIINTLGTWIVKRLIVPPLRLKNKEIRYISK